MDKLRKKLEEKAREQFKDIEDDLLIELLITAVIFGGEITLMELVGNERKTNKNKDRN